MNIDNDSERGLSQTRFTGITPEIRPLFLRRKMNSMRRILSGIGVLSGLLLAISLQHVNGTTVQDSAESSRAQAQKLLRDGNHAEGLVIYQQLLDDETAGGQATASDLQRAASCLQQLNRVRELDELLESTVELHADDWQVLAAAARLYQHSEHFGFLIGGQFERGHHRGGGSYVSAQSRDRVRSLQLLLQALRVIEDGEEDASAVARSGIWSSLASVVRNQQFGNVWRLQDLTDLTTLPDYDETLPHVRFHHSAPGAPVDEDNNPILYALPDSWQAAASDGERWRWALHQTVALSPQRQSSVDLEWAGFLQSQFGVRPQYHGAPPQPLTGDASPQAAVRLHTLTDDETIAHLATGERRLTLPAEFRHIAVIQDVIDRADSSQRRALDMMLQIRMNRQQYPQAAQVLRAILELESNEDQRKQLQDRIQQIEGNWVEFEAARTQAAGKPAVLEVRYRNGSRVTFTARPVDVERLLADTRQYLESPPQQLDHNRIQIQNVGYRLVHDDQEKYLGDPAASWELELTAPELHFDDYKSVTTPLQKAGAWWVTANMQDGNSSSILLWIADAAITKKHVEDGTLYFLADADTGSPLDRVDLEFFGYRVERIGRTRRHRVVTRRFAERTDDNGLCMLSDQQKLSQRMQWVAVARTKDGRLAFDGFSNFWQPQPLSQLHYSPVKVYTVTDRPVYRPQHEVRFRQWVRRPRFDEDTAQYADTSFVVQIRNPRGDVVEERMVTSDRWGGIDGSWTIPADAVLGQYSLEVCTDVRQKNRPVIGSGSFRVEEYRKPEFEVSIDAPEKPVRLGDSVTATINANYYFGAPVTSAKVHYKVERTRKDSRWYPVTRWDWLYSPGYWWFAPDAAWYPGWNRWGCFAPVPPWIGWSPDPPEVVAEGDATIGADGKFTVDIDTESALQQHSDSDHSYTITAEVTDQSRRTISGKGEVLVARDPFRVFVWTDRGHYQSGDTVTVSLQARTPDGRGVAGAGKAALYQVTWNDGEAVEQEVETFDIATDEQGTASLKMVIPQAGQYRVSCSVTDSDGITQEGGQLLYVRGPNDDGSGYRFNDLELIVDKREYQPGETAVLQINTNHADSTVLLFVRPVNGVCPRPEVIRLQGKSTTHNISIRPQDMPNIYVEALTIADGRIHSTLKEIFVPPTRRVADVQVIAAQEEYRPGETAEVTLKLTDEQGQPFVGNAILTAYDASLEYIAAGATPEIRSFFWNVRRHHRLHLTSTLQRVSHAMNPSMRPLGSGSPRGLFGRGEMFFGTAGRVKSRMLPQAAGMAAADMAVEAAAAPSFSASTTVEPTVRSEFADTALWLASADATADGIVTASFKVPDNLTTWRIKAWTLGEGTRVGAGTTDVICSKNLIIRPQTPRFFTEKDQITLSGIVHNYLDSAKDVEVVLETEGGQLRHLTSTTQSVRVEAGGEVRVDWPVQVVASGTATVRMKALTNEESDAAELQVPAQIHGILKTESFAGVIRNDENSSRLQLQVPAERIEQHSRLEVRYSPSLAGAMVDALPYLLEYPYGCTEQTLNRFLPAVITQQTLLGMGLDLDEIRTKQTNLNAQERGTADQRSQRWNRINVNPVFDNERMQAIVRDGVQALTEMQLSDGGWGWFSGYGERSSPHLTALVVHGLTVAQASDVPVLPDVIQRGVSWLQTYQATELTKLVEGDRRRELGDDAGKSKKPYRMQAANMDALVAWVLSEHNGSDAAMADYLYRDRLKLSVYGLSLTGLLLHQQQAGERRDMVLRNIEQYLQQDDENQTAWLNLPGGSWWYWYGSENEAHAMYLRLLLKVRPRDETASRLVKYLLNNRRAAGHWNSTRDTALVIESMAEYIRVTGEDRPDMTVQVLIDGQPEKRVRITADNFFSFDNVIVLEGDAVRSGTRQVEIRREGTGPLYFNAYLTNFTQEDPITAAGLEVKVQRRFYRLERDDRDVSVRGDRGQSVKQQSTRWKRIPLDNLAQVDSGDLVEVELLVDSKNDYEYLLLEDLKPSGFEPDDQRSGYVDEGLRAYRELRDNRVSFFLSQLARGNHSISYRLRAETPGQMAALPARIEGMYAPELVGNSNEFRLQVVDQSP